METTVYNCDHMYFGEVQQDYLTDEEKNKLYVEADPSIVEILPTGEIYVTQLEYRKKLTEVFGVGGWQLIPCSAWFEDVNCRRQLWALKVRGNILSYAWGEDETYRIREDNIPTNSPSFAAPEIAKSNALMRATKDLLLFHNLWDKNFIRKFQDEYCEKVPVLNKKTGRMEDQWRKKGDDEARNTNTTTNNSIPTTNTSYAPNTPIKGILVAFDVPGTNNKKSGRALFSIGEDKLETTFFNVPTGVSSFEELSKYVNKPIIFTYKQNGRWANLISVQLNNNSEIGLLRKEIKAIIERKAKAEKIDEVTILQRWGKTTVEDITTIDEATHICYELEQ